MTPLPHNPATEKHVLATCLLDNGPTYQRALQNGVSDASFHDPRNRIIWKALGRCAEPALELLIPELGEHLETAGGMPYLMEITSGIATTVHAETMIKQLREYETKRSIIRQATDLIEHAGNGSSIPELEEQIRALTPAPSKDDIRESVRADLEARRIRASSPPPEPTVRLYLAKKPIATPGNLVTLISKAKTGKTATLGAATAAIISAASDRADVDTFGFTSPHNSKQAVVVIDTEQSPYDAFTCYQRALKRAKQEVDPAWLCHYSLVGLSAAQTKDALEISLEKAQKDHGGIFTVILDGAADCVSSVNDEAECNGFVSWLRALAVKFNCPIICVIHSNESIQSGDDGRGHLGKQLIRKAESNLLLKKTGDITTITSEKQRKAPITDKDGVSFQWSDEAQMHVSCSNEPKKIGSKKKHDIEDYTSVFPTIELSAKPFAQLYNLANHKRPIHRNTFWNLVEDGVERGLIQVNRANVNDPRYWVR